jgi:hypothetical protein
MVSAGALIGGLRPVRDLRVCVSDGGGNDQLDLGAGIGLTPDSQFRPDKSRAFMHAGQTVMSVETALVQNLRVDSFSVVPDVHPKLPFVVMDIHFDSLGGCMTERIAQSLRCNPIDFVPEDGSEFSGCAFDEHTEIG